MISCTRASSNDLIAIFENWSPKWNDISRTVLIEKDVEIDDESEEMDIEVDAEVSGQSADDSGLEGLLKKAREMARDQGNDKLVRQISNTIIQHERSIAADEEA